ncbi:MAG: methionine--tRNA ligase, partial [Planctomycetota bacterium]
MSTRYLVTAGLPYSNGRLHVGHIAGAYLPADTYVRFRKACGDDVRFVCGSDDNGVTALLAARKEGIPVEQLTARYNARQAADFAGLGIEFDIYGGTHQPEFVDLHNRISQDFFRAIHAKGFFTKKKMRQLYDVQAQQFLPDRYVKGRCYHKLPDGSSCDYPEAYGDQCEACGNAIDPTLLIDPVSTITNTRPEPRETVHWYLRLDQFEQPLREWLESKRAPADGSPKWRDFVLNFALGQIKQGLPERPMTRDLDWGVPVPLDDPDAAGKVLYVWFDAPIGYVSFTAKLCERETGNPQDYERWWKSPDSRIVHFVGEDNTIFHALIWPAMLMAEGSYQLPWQVVVNSFLNIKFPGEDEQKISKSRGKAIWIQDYLESFEPDPLRYYLTAIAPESARTAFEPADFVARNNNELVAAFGNFVNRTLTFAHKYFDGRVPDAAAQTEADRAHLVAGQAALDAVGDHLDNFRFRAGLEEMMAYARACNLHFSNREPWASRKSNLEDCGAAIATCIHAVRTLAVLCQPFLPATARRIAAQLATP